MAQPNDSFKPTSGGTGTQFPSSDESKGAMAQAKDKISDVTDMAKDKFSEAKDMASDKIGEAKEMLGDLPNTLSEKASQLSDKASQAVSGLSDRSDEALHTVGEKIVGVAATLREKAPLDGKFASAANAVASSLESGGDYLVNHGVGDIAGDMTGLIRKYPVQSLWVGIGIGVLLGTALSRK